MLSNMRKSLFRKNGKENKRANTEPLPDLPTTVTLGKNNIKQSFFQPIFEGDYHPLPENFDILDTFFKFLDTFFMFWTLVSSFWTQFSSFDSHFLNICHLAVAPKSWWQVPAKQLQLSFIKTVELSILYNTV